MAEAAGAGTLRALNDHGIIDQLASIASVSGGTWFNTQFGFSATYYDKVINSCSGGISNPLDTWYTAYQQTSGQGLFGYFGTGGTQWEGGISGMETAYDSALTNLPAINANRKGNQNADLLFCTTLVGQSLMDDNATLVQLSSNGVDASYSVPGFWAVPTSGSESWHVPGVNLSSAKWTLVSNSSQSTSDVSAVLAQPTVTKIASASSAANGATANPQLQALFQPQSEFVATFGSGQNPGNGVCTTPGLTCSFPSQKLMDGCYNDNLGMALNVGYLQKKYPGKKLRLMGVSSEICNRNVDPTCTTAVRESAFRSLFSNSPYATVEGWLPAIVPGPNRTIFAESITDLQAYGQSTGYGAMSFMTGTFTTIENSDFGVAAGTTVSLLVMNVNGQLYLQAGANPYGSLDGLSDTAVNAYDSWKQLLTSYTTNGKVDSSTAFLYYQSVQTNAPTPTSL